MSGAITSRPTFLSASFTTEVQHEKNINGYAYFRSFEFSQAAEDLFRAVALTRSVLKVNPMKKKQAWEFLVHSASEHNFQGLITTNGNYDISFDKAIEAIEAEMDAVGFAPDYNHERHSEKYVQAFEMLEVAEFKLDKNMQEAKEAVRSRLTLG